MSKVEMTYDTKTGKHTVSVDGKKQDNVKHVYLHVGDPNDRYDKSRIEVHGHEPGANEGDVSKHYHITASIGEDASTHFSQKGNLQYNYLGHEIKDPDNTLKEAIANIFKNPSKLFTTDHLNQAQIPHVKAE